MKRTVLFAFLFVFAGALVASARVEWIPTTRDEIIAYKQNEVEVVLVDLISYDTNGLLVVVSPPQKYYGGSVNLTNMFIVMGTSKNPYLCGLITSIG